MIAALPNFSVGAISNAASTTALNGGTMVEIFKRPAISQSTAQTTSDRIIFMGMPSYVLPQHSPDLVDGVEVAPVAPDLVRAAAVVDIRSHDFGHPSGARREQRDLVREVGRLL